MDDPKNDMTPRRRCYLDEPKIGRNIIYLCRKCEKIINKTVDIDTTYIILPDCSYCKRK